ncbi:MAG: beta-N-acetylhexosaminidase, partial [Muribaculaceae bacterium]|nr:beta-N-acetylhexosaminidase [Muribaculaceae bacterium]
AHNVLLLPEIDMPGHSAAFVRTFGHDMQSPEGMKVLKQLVDEACNVFDVPYLHIGTDEVKFTNPDFVPEMVKFVRDRNKKVVSWNPGWKYDEGEIDLTTMWSFRGKPTPGVPAVDVRFHYINHFDTYADLVALYRSNVYGHKKAEDGIVGVEIALWNDRLVDNEPSLIAQNSVYTAMLAVAERSWYGGGEEYFDRLGTNLNEEFSDDFKAFSDFENKLLWHKDNTLASIYIPYVRQTNVRWLITDAFPNGGDLSTAFPPETDGLKDKYVYNDSVYHTAAANGAAVYLRHYWGSLIPGFYTDPQPNHTAYAFTWVYAPEDMQVGLQAETQNYSRSESDIAPPAGKWDYRESKIWINDREIQAPVWTSTHTERTNEISLGNENMSAREPIPVTLHEGWNKVLIKLPVGEFKTPETRLVKWMFTFVFTTPDGKAAAPGLIYSPYKTR